MPELHAVLSPSSSERWLTCLASVRMGREVGKDESSPYAEEGTDAHSVAEVLARRTILHGGLPYRDLDAAMTEKYGEAGYAEMTKHAKGYVEYLRSRMALYSDPKLYLEQKVQTGIEGCWGTSDAVIVAAAEGVLEIHDLKYGAGVAVSAENNPQLKLYALGALERFGLLADFSVVVTGVYQPRAFRGSLPTSWEYKVSDLEAWREKIRPLAARALHDDDAPFAPSQEACRWCPAAGVCTAQADHLLSIAKDEFRAYADSDVLSPERMGEILDAADEIRAWLDAVSARAFRRAYEEGQPIPGYKVVQRGGRRYVADTTAAMWRLAELGYSTDDFANTKLRSLGDLEKILGGRNELDAALGSCIKISEPKLALARGSHEDPDAITALREAASEFEELE